MFSASLSTSVRPSGSATAAACRASAIAVVVVAGQHPLAGQVGVRPGQLGAGPERLEDRERRLGRGDRLGAAAQAPHAAGQQAQRVALAQPVAGLPPQRERPLAGAGGLLPAVDQRHLPGEPVVQPGGRSAGAVGVGREPQRPLELRGRLAVRGQLGGPPRRPAARSASTAGRVAGRLGVEGQPGVVGAADRPAARPGSGRGCRRRAVRRRPPARPPAGRSRAGTAAPPSSA